MLRSAINKRLFQIAFFPSFGLKNSHNIESDKKSNEITPVRVGIDKIKDFLYDENGQISNELQSIMSTTTVGFITGFVIGGIPKIKLTAENFIAENQATIFRSQYEAKRQLHYKAFVAFFKGGVPFAIKLGTFCFLFSTTAAVLQKHNGMFDPLQHVIAGAVAGCVYKINTGLKGAFAGSILGSILGTISGITVSVILYATGIDMSDLFKANNKWMNARRNLIKEQMSFMNEETEMFKKMYDENQNVRKVVYGDEKEKK